MSPGLSLNTAFPHLTSNVRHLTASSQTTALAQVFPQQSPQAADTILLQRPIVFPALADDIAH